MESSVNKVSVDVQRSPSFEVDTYSAPMVGHVKGSDIAATGVWEVVNKAGQSVMGRAAKIKSTGANCTLMVHPITSIESNGSRYWYELELVAGQLSEGCLFDAVDFGNSVGVVKANLTIIL
jgi:hypothetical protein